MKPFWASGFVDLEPSAYDAGLAFWRDVTGWSVSSPRGETGEFVSLVPPVGDGHVLVQRLTSGPSRIHVDLHVDDPRAAADRAVSLGAREVADLGYVVLASPGGFLFCLVPHRASERAPATEWPDGHTSLVDQVCIDIPGDVYDREETFWQELTGSSGVEPSPRHGEFRWLTPTDGHGARLLLQRLGDPHGEVRGHLDLSTTDRAAEAARHEALGATRLADFDIWTLLADPAGLAYCVTDRLPS